MKITVTGSEGFIGKHLVKRFEEEGMAVMKVDRLCGKEIVETEFQPCDAIVHLAAQTSVWNSDVDQIIRDNIVAFKKVVDEANRLDVPLIYASSSCAANITSAYGITKLFDEQFAKIYCKKSVGVRFHNVYGKDQRSGTLLQILTEASMTGKTVTLYNNGNNVRHFTHVDDICYGILMILQNVSRYDELVNICNPEQTSVIEFCDEVRKYVDFDYVRTDQKLKYDKIEQKVDENIQTLRMVYKDVKTGLKQVFE